MRSRGERIGAAVQDERSRGLPMTLRRVLYTASLCGALLAPPSAMPAHASEAGAHASIASTSRWLMGAIERTISGDARVGIHRPSLQAAQEGGPRQASEDEIIAAMSVQLVLYAQQMNVPRTFIDALMLVPPDRVELLSASELATYGINALDAVALEERRAHSQFLPR
jgi:hypothetical protein